MIKIKEIGTTTMEKALLGAKCHKEGDCKACPYHEVDTMLDPRIDPSYGSHVMDCIKKCRDNLIADLTATYIDMG